MMMKMKWEKLILIVGVAVLIGLLISLKLLQASAKEDELPSIADVAAKAVKDYDLSEAFNAKVLEKIKNTEEERSFLSINASLLKSIQQAHPKKGEPLFWVSCGRLYPVAGNGEVLSEYPGQSCYDVPILTGNGLKINPSTNRLDGSLFLEAVNFIRSLKRKNPLLAQQVSEVHCDPKLGLVVYFSHTGILPIVVGRGRVEEKCKRVSVMFEEIGTSELVSFARYVDARFEKQLVLKRKN